MAKRLRALRADFRHHMDLHDAWPTKPMLDDAIRKYKETGVRNETCRALKDGEPQPVKYLMALVACLREPHFKGRPPGPHVAFVDFLRSRGATPDACIPDLIDIVSEPPNPESHNVLLWGVEALSYVARRYVSLTKRVQLCKSEEDVGQAVSWMYTAVGRQCARTSLTIKQAIERGESRIGLSLAKYQNIAVRWHRIQPWTIMLASGFRKPIGMCIAIPLTEPAYEEVRSGAKRITECMEAELSERSAQVVVVGFAMRPTPSAAEMQRPNVGLFIANLCQLAHLTNVPGIVFDIPMRLLGFAGTPEIRKHLERIGYRRTGTCLKGTDIEYMERTLFIRGDESSHSEDWQYGIWRGLQKAVDANGCHDKPEGLLPVVRT